MQKFAILLLLTLTISCGSKSKSEPDPPGDDFVRGADVGWITEMEAAGRKFYTTAGQEMEGMSLLKSLGLNTIRLRVWVNPTAGWNGAADLLPKAKRAKDLGMRLMIDFHYSDSWADPGKQNKPAAWESMTFNELKAALATHTVDILTQLKNAGINPEWVQVGNETNDGLLWPDGRASTQMNQYAQLIDTGYVAVKSVFPASKVIVHLSDGWNNDLYKWNIGGLIDNGARFDVIGMSLYPTWFGGSWQDANTQCQANLNDMLTRYGKELMVVEVGMPWDQANDCKMFIADLIQKVKSVPDNKGLGVLYWEPLSYNNWHNYTLGAFDNNGKPTAAMEGFR